MKTIIIKPAFDLFIKYMLVCSLLSACDFNITDIPGPQVSSTIKSSKNHNAFIGAYEVNGNKINGNEVASIFAERQYNLAKGLFGQFTVDCCNSQLVIVFKEPPNLLTLNDVPTNWTIAGFKMHSSDIIVKYYNKVNFPDTIKINVIPNVKDSLKFESLTLHKITL